MYDDKVTDLPPSTPAYRPVILYRGDDFEQYELEAAQAAGFKITNSRMSLDPFDLVVPRYSALPFYKELEHDVTVAGGKLINSYKQHRYVADLANWYQDLEAFTPKTWFRPSDVPMDEPGSFILKGETNSKKFLFAEMMYAPDRSQVGRVLARLQDDSLIGQQNIYVRQYEPFYTYKRGLHGLPVTREFRFFAAYGQILSGGFYWSSHIDELREAGVPESEFDPETVPKDFLAKVLARIGNNVTFVCVDVAELTQDNWRVVELNDGQMAGLSENDPKVLYPALMKAIKKHVNIYPQG